MRKTVSLVIYVLVAGTIWAQTVERKVTLGDWGVLTDPAGDCDAKLSSGSLEITIPAGLHNMTHTDEGAKLNAPRILREVRGDFSFEITVNKFAKPKADTSSDGKHSFVSTGIVVYDVDNQFIRLERAAVGENPDAFVWMERFKDGKRAKREMKVTDGDTSLRFSRTGNVLKYEMRDSKNQEWRAVVEEKAELPAVLKVGVLAINTTTAEHHAKVVDQKLKMPK